MTEQELDLLLEGSIYDDDMTFERRNGIKIDYGLNEEDSYDDLKSLYKIINENRELNSMDPLNEDSMYGTDPTHWTKGLGWLGVAIAAIMALLFKALKKLYNVVKNEILAWILKRYMYKIVEITDNGLGKKTSLFSKKDRTCFKTLREGAERQCLVNTLKTEKFIGLSNDNSPLISIIKNKLGATKS